MRQLIASQFSQYGAIPTERNSVGSHNRNDAPSLAQSSTGRGITSNSTVNPGAG